MANIRYFAEHNGETVQLANVWMNVGAPRLTAECFKGRAPDGTILTAQRMVEFKRQPSRHECDSRCLNATGRVMKCECACGGKNHGKGAA